MTPCTGPPVPGYAPFRATYRRASLTGEFDLIAHLRRRLPPAPSGETWIGDDAAVVRGPGDGPSGASLLLAADAVVAGVHADLSLVGLDDLGWKAVAVNVSDLAAMGGRPAHVLVTLVLPEGTDADRLYDGVAAAAAEWECAVVGGDVCGGPGLVVAVAVTGSVDGGGPPVLRSGAQAGDHLFVTGPLGGSAAGLALLRAGLTGRAADARLVDAHRRPRARVAEGEAARRAGATAMIDVSDGLAADLRHLADASGVGVVVDRVPVDERVPLAAGDPVALALGGGEDYELVFSAPDPAAVVSAFAGAGLRPPIAIGHCTADPGERRLASAGGGGDDGELPAVGWEHLW